MNQLISLLILHLLIVLFFPVEAQFDGTSPDTVSNFQPSLAVVIGVLCVMFFLTFLLLIYAKFCHRRSSVNGDSQDNTAVLVRSRSRYSGIDKTVIESLPFFRFSSLKGSKEGLECAVCLSKFEEIEVLRLLPKCKHAFHINCVDQWLEKHSSCPLCRCKISADDPAIFTYSNSMRFLANANPPELRQDSNVELFVEREEVAESHGVFSSRFSIGNSFRKVEKFNGDEEAVLIQDDNSDYDQTFFHKYNHKIVMSDVVLNNRWSSVSSSDLMFLSSEMLHDLSSNRFSSFNSKDQPCVTSRIVQGTQILKIKEEMEMKRLFESKGSTTNKFSQNPSTSDSEANRSSFISSADRRSVSEITGFSRFRNLGTKNSIGDSFSGGNNREEQRLRSLWLPIARKTVQWFANRERTYQHNENPIQTLHV